MNNKVVVITGMHRSGTSVIAQWLHRCGLHIGDTLLGPGTGNDEGHFEDVDFLLLHQELLLNRNLPDTGLTNKSVGMLTALENENVSKLITLKNMAHRQWGWKEPRTCLFLNDYNVLLPQAFYFVVVRSYNDTVNSLVARAYKTQEEKINRKSGIHKLKWKWFKRKSMQQMLQQQASYFLQVWINYCQHILQQLQNAPTEKIIITDCSTLLEKDEAIFLLLTQQWQLTLNYLPFKNIYKQQRLSTVNDITPYIKNKELLEKANQIKALLQNKFTVRL
jgi:hypothetical protein